MDKLMELVCVGGPLAGEVYTVDPQQNAVILPVLAPETPAELALDRGFGTAAEGAQEVLYVPSQVLFAHRALTVLLHPPMRSQTPASQEDAICRALMRPEAYQQWRRGRRRG